MEILCGVLFCLTILFILFDIHYFIYAILVFIVSIIKHSINPKDFRQESVHYGFCFTTDLDLMFHMNNARYLRECDFGRFILLTRCGIIKMIRTMGGSNVLGASSIRYRKSINFLSPYRVKTKILCWDEKSFYLEQKFESLTDHFVYAIVLIKQTLIKVRPQEVIQSLGYPSTSPEFPEDIQRWIESNQISSDKLRNGKVK